MTDSLLWVSSAALIVVGLAGTVLPAVPGTALVLGGIVLGAWIDDFTRVGWGTLIVVTLLAVAAWVLDYVAGLLGARRAGASGLALIGAAVGTVAGLFMGLVGVLFMPLVGATLGELLARRRTPDATGRPAQGGQAAPAAEPRAHIRAIKVGIATWLGIMAGLVAKVVIAFMMVGIFVAAMWI
jgi:uncharacterized protein